MLSNFSYFPKKKETNNFICVSQNKVPRPPDFPGAHVLRSYACAQGISPVGSKDHEDTLVK